MLTLDYNFLLKEHFSYIEKGNRMLSFLRWVPGIFKSILFRNVQIERINKNLRGQLLELKGMQLELLEAFSQLEGKTITLPQVEKLLKSTNGLLHKYIVLRDDVEKMILEFRFLATRLHATKAIVTEMVETLYESNRILKKMNKVIPIQRTQLTSTTSVYSIQNLKRVHNGR